MGINMMPNPPPDPNVGPTFLNLLMQKWCLSSGFCASRLAGGGDESRANKTGVCLDFPSRLDHFWQRIICKA